MYIVIENINEKFILIDMLLLVSFYLNQREKKLLKELASKCNQLEGKLNSISKWTNITKEKINIVNWLNTNYSNEKINDYNNWFNNLKINETQLNYLFERGYVEGVVAVLKEYLPSKKKDTDIDTRPLKAFTGKENICSGSALLSLL